MNITKILSAHLETIKRCLKGGDVLLPEITEFDVDLIHAAVGISTEAGELMEAILPMQLASAFEMHRPKRALDRRGLSPQRPVPTPWDGDPGVDIDNIVEELGDHLFYEGALRRLTGLENLEATGLTRRADLWPRAFGPLHDSISLGRKRVLADLIMIHYALAGKILDVAKRKVIYRNPFDVVYKEGKPILRDLLAQHLVDDCWVVSRIAAVIGRSEESIREGNIMKLDKGKDARYKDGYSDKAASERADKEAEETGVDRVREFYREDGHQRKILAVEPVQAASERADKQEPSSQLIPAIWEADSDVARAFLEGAPAHEAIGMTVANPCGIKKVVFGTGVDEGFDIVKVEPTWSDSWRHTHDATQKYARIVEAPQAEGQTTENEKPS